MLKVQEYLINHSVDDLQKEPFNLTIRDYPDHGIMTLNYSQIDSPKNDPIIRECRALILENKPPYNVVSRAFDRFYNFGECQRTSEWESSKINNAKVVEKIDGSLIPAYYFDDKWNVSTRKMAFAEGETVRGNTFHDVIMRVLPIDRINIETDKDFCPIFEMVSFETRVVKPYPTDDIYLLGMRNRVTGLELNREELEYYGKQIGVKLPSIYDLCTFDDIIKNMKNLPAFDEGYVVTDYSDFARIKIKNPSYLAIAHLRGNGALSMKRVALLVMEQDQEEYLTYFPEDIAHFQPYVDSYKKMYEDVHNTFNEFKDCESQKDFAMAVKDKPASGILFAMRKGSNFEDASGRLSENSKLDLLEGYK